MGLMTGEEYRNSIKNLKKTVYLMGEQIDIVEHPIARPVVNLVSDAYDFAFNPEYKDLFTTVLDSGEEVNRALTLMKSTDDLIGKYKRTRIVTLHNGRGNVRTAALDELNALGGVTYEMDQKLGTEYYEKFLRYLDYVQKNDFLISGEITDPKGDRSLRPSQQADPDMYLRIVEKKKDGIVVCGAKTSQTIAIHAHEHIVAPCTSLREGEEQYAVAFAIPADAEGIIHFYGRQYSDTRRMEPDSFDAGNLLYGCNESLMVFDHVFVPWERVFMCGEWEWSVPFIKRFGGYHRMGYGASKSAAASILIGAAALMAEYNGLSKDRIIRDKLAEMVHMAETIYACGLTCCVEGYRTPSGIYNVNSMYTNVTKLNAGRLTFEIARLAEDIAGGLVATLPSSQDLNHPEVGKYINKYLKGVDGVSTEHRMRLMRLIEWFCHGTGSLYFLSESLHGAGSPQAQKIFIERESDLETKKHYAKRLAGIPE